jgi:DNA-binding CsgD family transcriptional regulator
MSRPKPREHSPFTTRERQVYGMLAGGLAQKEIAYRLQISQKSVSTYVMQGAMRLGLASASHLVQHAHRAATAAAIARLAEQQGNLSLAKEIRALYLAPETGVPGLS